METSLSDRPLLRVAMSYYMESCIGGDFGCKERVKSLFKQLIEKVINFETCKNELKKMNVSILALERLGLILNTPLSPPKKTVEIDSLKMDSERKKHRHWENYEDYRLIRAFDMFGENWSEIAKFVGNNRTKYECSQRWKRVLDPDISKDPWTDEEEMRLRELVKEYGPKKWKIIASKMGNRCDVQCRYRFLHSHNAQNI